MGPTKTTSGPQCDSAMVCHARQAVRNSATVDAFEYTVMRTYHHPASHSNGLEATGLASRQCIVLALVNLHVGCLEGYGTHQARMELGFRPAGAGRRVSCPHRVFLGDSELGDESRAGYEPPSSRAPWRDSILEGTFFGGAFNITTRRRSARYRAVAASQARGAYIDRRGSTMSQ